MLRLMIAADRLPLDIVARAKVIAQACHEGQVDKIGQPYIGHPEYVAGSLAGHDPVIVAVAWLHDAVEDSDFSLEELAQAFPDRPDLVEAVDAMTHRPHEAGAIYIARITSNAISRIVKPKDIEHNTSPERMNHLDSATRDRLTAKYARYRSWIAQAHMDNPHWTQLDQMPDDALVNPLDRVAHTVCRALSTAGLNAGDAVIASGAVADEVMNHVQPILETHLAVSSLGVGAVIRDDNGQVYRYSPTIDVWEVMGRTYTAQTRQVALPAVVLDF